MRQRVRAAVAALLLALSPAALHAHPGQPLAPHDLWGAWALDPVVVVSLLLSAVLYARGTRALWRRAPRRGVTPARALLFAAGWLVLAVALVSPMHPLGEVLLSGHMVQHELLMVVAAPLLVLGRPVVAWVWALPIAWRRTAGSWAKTRAVRGPWRVVTGPFAATLLQGVAVIVWHLPRAYQATLRSDAVHAAQHASFLATALLFWWALVHARDERAGPGAAVLCLFGTMMYTGALGALLTFSGAVWYPAYEATTGAWGLTPIEDQQLAGLIMWVPAGVSYLIAALLLFARWMHSSEWRMVQRERRALANGR